MCAFSLIMRTCIECGDSCRTSRPSARLPCGLKLGAWVQADSGKTSKAFMHIPSTVGAYEAEEIGMEHLLRDVKDATVSTLATRIGGKMESLKSLEERLKEIRAYLDAVCEGRLPLNHDITNNLQDVFNLLPNLNVASLVEAFSVKSNDMMVVMYLSALIRSITAVHNLINNKIHNKNEDRDDPEKTTEKLEKGPDVVPP